MHPTTRVALRVSRDLRATRTRPRDLFDRAASASSQRGGVTLAAFARALRSLRVAVTKPECRLLFTLLGGSIPGGTIDRRAIALLWRPQRLKLIDPPAAALAAEPTPTPPLDDDVVLGLREKLIQAAARTLSRSVQKVVEHIAVADDGESVSFTEFKRGIRRSGVSRSSLSDLTLARIYEHIDRDGAMWIDLAAIYDFCGVRAPSSDARSPVARRVASPRSPPRFADGEEYGDGGAYGAYEAYTDAASGAGGDDARAQLVADALWLYQEELLHDHDEPPPPHARAASRETLPPSAPSPPRAAPPLLPPHHYVSPSPSPLPLRAASPPWALTTVAPSPPSPASPPPPRANPSAEASERSAPASIWIGLRPAGDFRGDAAPFLWVDADARAILDAPPVRATLDDGSAVWFTSTPPRRMLRDVRAMKRCAEGEGGASATLWLDPIARQLWDDGERARALMRERAAQRSTGVQLLSALPELSIGRAVQLRKDDAVHLSRALILASSSVALAVIPHSCRAAMSVDAKMALDEKCGGGDGGGGGGGDASPHSHNRSPLRLFDDLARAGEESRAAAAAAAAADVAAEVSAAERRGRGAEGKGDAERALHQPDLLAEQPLSATFAAIQRKAAIARGADAERAHSRRRVLVAAPDAAASELARSSPYAAPRSSAELDVQAATAAEAVRRAGMFEELQEKIAEAKSAIDAGRDTCVTPPPAFPRALSLCVCAHARRRLLTCISSPPPRPTAAARTADNVTHVQPHARCGEGGGGGAARCPAPGREAQGDDQPSEARVPLRCAPTSVRRATAARGERRRRRGEAWGPRGGAGALAERRGETARQPRLATGRRRHGVRSGAIRAPNAPRSPQDVAQRARAAGAALRRCRRRSAGGAPPARRAAAARRRPLGISRARRVPVQESAAGRAFVRAGRGHHCPRGHGGGLGVRRYWRAARSLSVQQSGADRVASGGGDSGGSSVVA